MLLNLTKACQAKRVFERVLYKGSVVGKGGLKGLKRHAHGFCQPFSQSWLGWQQMGLSVFPVLQHVLGFAQENIGLRQRLTGSLRQQACALLGIQRLEQATMLQGGHFAAANQLRELHDKFDFTNAATAQLDVVIALQPWPGERPSLPILPNALSEFA